MQNPITDAYNLLQRGALQEAEAACRRALVATHGRDPQAWTAFGAVLREQGRVQESEAAYRHAITLAPGYVPARHNLGALLSQLERAEEALSELDRAQALGLSAPELHINRGRALLQLYRLEEAERAYASAVALTPRDRLAQVCLAQLRYMRGDPAFARDFVQAVQAHPGDVSLQLGLADLLRSSGNLPGAESIVRGLIKAQGALPQLRAALATLLHEAGRLKEAEIEALEAAVGTPHDPGLIETLVAIELALGRPEEALPLVRSQRQRQPHEQRWIAYEATAARLLRHPSYRALYDYSGLVKVFDLAPPPGWSSIEEFNAALASRLRARHLFATHPLDQSLRNGSQTARSLTTEQDPVIRALLGAFEPAVQEYLQGVGVDAAHPLRARNRGKAILAGCWSVELRRNGFHTNHVHPQGWISSAYYVSVPPEASDPDRRSGWLKFGEPGAPIPGLEAEHFVQPRAGRLVLFPSYMWHGTNAIRGEEPRLSVAFDAIPA